MIYNNDDNDEIWNIFIRLKIELSRFNLVLDYDQTKEVLKSLNQAYKQGVESASVNKANKEA